MSNENWILRYYQMIQDGSVTVGKWIQLLYEKIIQDLENKVYFFDQKKANRVIAFFEKFTHHSKGRLAPQLVKLEIWQKALTADVLVFATPIYYYEMSGQLKTMLDRLNPLYPSDYKFTDVYFLSSAAEDEEHVPEKAVNGVEGWVECFEKARLAGTVFMGGVTAAGEKPDHPALKAAREMGRKC